MNHQNIVHALPVIDGDSKQFWEGCQNHKLLIQRCKDCNQYIFYPRIVCPHCMSEQIEWVESSGKGKVYSYTVARRHPSPEFNEKAPYIVALITLEEGVRMMSNLVNVNIDEARCDLPVEVVFEKVNETITLPKFQPIR